MVLAPHAVAGAATAFLFSKYPVIGFIAAFASHFVLDAIPHWHYRVDSIQKDASRQFGQRLSVTKKTFADLGRMTIDAGIGFGLTFIVSRWIFPNHFFLLIGGAAAAVLPDALQVAYYFFPNSPLKYLQKFHVAVHSKKRFDDRHAFGVACQLVFSAAVILLLAVI